MALAVSVGEGLAHWAVEPRVKAFLSRDDEQQWHAKWDRTEKRSRYRLIDLVRIEAQDVEPWDFVRQVLIAPISRFFTPFRPGDSVPSVMSRHVVAHDPSPDHMSPVNAIKSVMLVGGNRILTTARPPGGQNSDAVDTRWGISSMSLMALRS
jgi:hypothetical protein